MGLDAQQANDAAKRGDFRAAVDLASMPGSWGMLFRTRCALAGLAGFTLPHPSEVEPGEVARETIGLLARAAFVSLDGGVLAECQMRGRQITGDNDTVEVLAGLGRAIPSNVGALIERARAAGQADALVDVTTAAAMSATLTGQLETATDHARRASRMAAAEEMPQCVYFANLMLARVRRLTGRPHHACRILFGLARVAPPIIQPWLEWELALNARLDVEYTTRSGAAIARVLVACADGRRDEANDLATRLDAAIELEWQRRDLAALVGSCGVGRDIPESIASWVVGERDEIPAEIVGVATHSGPVAAEIASAAYVVVRPGARARRIVSLGLPVTDTVTRIDPEKGRAGRVETLIADLGLAGEPGRAVHEVFETVYKFDYEATPHSGVLRVLLHRARARLDGMATIERVDDRLLLRATEAFSVHDPRCEHRLEDVVLRMVAAHAGVGAKDVAAALGVPLSTVQKTLRQLAADGSVRKASGGGRRIEYHVEDTTFAEPTTHYDLRDPRR